jgi:polar amino acid transport system substrate-binding protein
MREDGRLRGFSIDLWDAIADKLGSPTQYAPYPSVKGLLGAVQAGKADLGIAAISVTAERDKTLDFSQPMYYSGLHIMVRTQNGGGAATSFWSVLFSRSMLQLVGTILLMIIVPAHIVWYVERHHPKGIIENKKYIPGIFKAIWWAAGTLGAQADEMPRSHFGRFIAVVWMFIGIAFVAFFTASITTSMTVEQLQGDINGPGGSGREARGNHSRQHIRHLSARAQREAHRVLADRAHVDALESARCRLSSSIRRSAVLRGAERQGKVQVVGPFFARKITHRVSGRSPVAQAGQ